MKNISNKFIAGIAIATYTVFTMLGCKEVGPEINLTETEYTTYLETPESASQKVVLLEDFTGAACPNCPDGHIAIAAVIDANPGRVVAIAEYNYFADPLYTDQIFVTDEAYNLNEYLGPVTGWPAIFIDRKDFGADDYLAELPENIATLSTEQISLTSPINLYVENTFDAGTRLLTTHVTIKYTDDVTTINKLSIALTESGIIAAQIDDNVGGEVPDYEHNHMLRKMLTYYAGDALPEENVAGRVYEFEYSYTLNADWNADNMHVVAFVHNAETDNKEVLQVAEVEVVE